ncbi:polyphosphate kinase 2 [Glaciecola sp. SC05]|uniref:polyphosphate kinase 2 n=1 Tax=Glaciecola sp. SC05 TaxID=1987355 RepID=UPI0035278AA6
MGLFPYPEKLADDVYRPTLRNLQIELLKLQHWVKATEHKIVIVFEGIDAAGKGGTIKRFTDHLNPRGARIVALNKPSDTERKQWYFQRYVEHLPAGGEIVLFDRSWYNRAGVEKVMGFCSDNEYQEFMLQAPQFESMLVRSDITLVKFWFDVSQDVQKERFEARRNDPLKRWKLSAIDEVAIGLWDEYQQAKLHMLTTTDTDSAPWTIVRSDDKRRARIHSIKYLLSLINYENKDSEIIGEVDPNIVCNARRLTGSN